MLRSVAEECTVLWYSVWWQELEGYWDVCVCQGGGQSELWVCTTTYEQDTGKSPLSQKRFVGTSGSVLHATNCRKFININVVTVSVSV